MKDSPLGPPQKGPKAHITIRMDPDLKKRLKQVAKKHQHTVTSVVEWSLNKTLSELE